MHNQIILISGAECWRAKFVGPHSSKVLELFGTDEIPTRFTSQTPPDEVHAEISRCNPDVFVSFA